MDDNPSRAPAAAASTGDTRIVRTDLFVPHVSTVTTDRGMLLPVHVVRKRALPSPDDIAAADRVVLCIHGTSVPAPVAFDLEHRDYSWMEALAREGFDVWAMSMTGYGWSAGPGMDDPANVDPDMQHHLIGYGLERPTAPHVRHALSTNQSEWDQIDTVVDYILGAAGADRLSLVVWSNGGPRGGGYASLHPDKVNRLFMHAPGPSEPGARVSREPDPVPLMTLQPRNHLFNVRWAANAPCEGQIAPEVFDVVWAAIMKYDPAGARWAEGGVMRWPSRQPYGWPDDMVRALAVPSLVLVGETDNPAARQATFDLIGCPHKVRVLMDCASHFVQWEGGRHILHRASAEWLRHGTFEGAERGEFRIDRGGRVTRER